MWRDPKGRLPYPTLFWYTPLSVCMPPLWVRAHSKDVQRFDALRLPYATPSEFLEAWSALEGSQRDPEKEEEEEDPDHAWMQVPIPLTPFRMQSALTQERFWVRHPGHLSVFFRMWASLSEKDKATRRQGLARAAETAFALFAILPRTDAFIGPPEHNPYFLLSLAHPTQEERAALLERYEGANPLVFASLRQRADALQEARARAREVDSHLKAYEGWEKPDPWNDETLQAMRRECTEWAGDPSLKEMRKRSLAMADRATMALDQRRSQSATRGVNNMLLGAGTRRAAEGLP